MTYGKKKKKMNGGNDGRPVLKVIRQSSFNTARNADWGTSTFPI